MRSPSSKSTAAPSVTVEEAQAAFGEIARELEEIQSRLKSIADGLPKEHPVREDCAYNADAIPYSVIMEVHPGRPASGASSRETGFWRRTPVEGGFDSHALPPYLWIAPRICRHRFESLGEAPFS